MRKRRKPFQIELAPVTAGNGLIDRRVLLGAGIGVAAMMPGPAALSGAPGRIDVTTPPSMREPGGPFTSYGVPSRWRADVQRLIEPMDGFETQGTSRTPLEKMEGTITPNGLHFERHHNGVPDIDPGKHRLFVHGSVRRPLAFSLDALMRYPMKSTVAFIECAGNSGHNSLPAPAQVSAGAIHGLLSCSEWTGVPLAILLDEAGVHADAGWVVAEGADAAAMARSIPLWKCRGDALVALYQNGEPIRPEQGFPMRLLLPGFEGNTNVKWLRRLRVQRDPAQSREETARYTVLQRNGKARQFVFNMKVKSVILRPSFGLSLAGPGLYEISGIAWSGGATVSRVDISADGGRSWAEAALDAPPTPNAVSRFRLAWRWNGAPCTLISRAHDDHGAVQPSRDEHMATIRPREFYHYNAMQAWRIAGDGSVTNVYV